MPLFIVFILLTLTLAFRTGSILCYIAKHLQATTSLRIVRCTVCMQHSQRIYLIFRRMTCGMHFPAETFICLKCVQFGLKFCYFSSSFSPPLSFIPFYVLCSAVPWHCWPLVQLHRIQFWLFDGYNSMKPDEKCFDRKTGFGPECGTLPLYRL